MKKSIKIGILCLIVLVVVSIIMWFVFHEENKTNNHGQYDYPPLVKKPVIYLYPTNTITLSIKLGKPENVTCSYPTYNDGWNVLANPDGTLIDLNTNRKIYSLYWEGKQSESIGFNDGFVIKKEDTIKFLENKLSILGLNEYETEEFIIYWLPELQKNPYNLIRFATIDEINKIMPLEFSIEPDTLIRTLMQFKGLNKYLNVKEQVLTPVIRKGFTVVEWGGIEIK